MTLRVSEVFVPGRLPQTTYNPRAEQQLEQHLGDYLDEAGAILTVAGPTKTGKSVLLRRVIETPIWVDGQGITSVDVLWGLIADELGLYTHITVGSAATDTGTAKVGSEAGLGGVLKVNAGAEYAAASTTQRQDAIARPLAAVVRRSLTGTLRPLVIDDFHFIDRDVQRSIVRALKPLVLAGVPIIFVSISHRVQDVVSAEPDMTGRVIPLHVPFWSLQELRFIAESGFGALNVLDQAGTLTARLAEESYGSPHLMQKFCRELCKVNSVRTQQSDPVALRAPDDWNAFFAAQADAASRDWFKRLLSGPQERGTKRTQWSIVDDGTLDGYGLTLLAVSKTGPQLTLTKDEIRQAVAAQVDGPGPAAQQTTRVLQHLSRIAGKRMTEPAPTEDELDREGEGELDSVPDVQPVLEYMEDDPNSKLHIADPFFAFFLKWGSEPYLRGRAAPESAQEADLESAQEPVEEPAQHPDQETTTETR